ncbi:MAG: hypothetical protein ACKOPG_10030 [Novosphingobium sp.]
MRTFFSLHAGERTRPEEIGLANLSRFEPDVPELRQRMLLTAARTT